MSNDTKPKWIKLKKYAEDIGATPNELHHKRREGVWAEDVIWRKAPDGKIYINWQAADRWIEGEI